MVGKLYHTITVIFKNAYTTLFTLQVEAAADTALLKTPDSTSELVTALNFKEKRKTPRQGYSLRSYHLYTYTRLYSLHIKMFHTLTGRVATGLYTPLLYLLGN